MFFNYNKERDRIWKKLEKSGVIIGYAKPGDTQKHDIYLRNGLVIVVDDNNTAEEMTIDTFLYLWLEKA